MEQQFANEVLETIKNEAGDNYDVSTVTSKKNNGLELTGIIIRDNTNRNKVEPIFYIDDYFDRGYSPYETAVSIMEKQKEIKEQGVPSFDVRDITNFEVIKDRIKAKLINLEMNENYLEDKPYIQVMDDLAICFYVDINGDTSATIPITLSLMEVWELEDANQLFEISYYNHEPAELISMPEAILGSMSEMDIEVMKHQSGNGDLTNEEFKEFLIEAQKDSIPMYVWREGSMLGATAMIYADNVKIALEKMGGDFIVLPSSIHELIVLPYSEEYTLDDLKQMIQDVNSTQLRADEVLSDHPYYVDKNGNIDFAKDAVKQSSIDKEER